jgi:hypothetical protein
MASLTGVKDKKDKNEPFSRGKKFFMGEKNKTGGAGQSFSQAFMCFSQAITFDPRK